jgi:hypothetical protein
MRLPNADKALVDIVKLRDYCLSMNHPRGRHKARVFASKLGLSAANAEELRQELLTAAATGAALVSGEDVFGTRYTLDFNLARPGRQAMVRSTWIVRRGEDIARLTSCYVL